MTIEFKCEEHSEKAHCAMAQLSGAYKPGLIRQVFADMHATTVTFRQLTSKNKPREFSISAAEADAFVEAWTAFKANTEEWLQFEAWRKEVAARDEHARQLAVWKQIEQLAQSIPGLEILAREESERWNEDEECYTTGPAWTVKHEATNQSNTDNFDVDDVLAEVKDVIEHYNSRLADCEEGEKEKWYGWHPIAEAHAKTFLVTHRAHQASKTAPLVDVNA